MTTTRSSSAATAQRPTPLHPYPAPPPPSTASSESRPAELEQGDKTYPPELGTDSIAVLEGRTFMCSNSLGDVPAGSIGGLLHNDTRFISRWELTLGGKPLSLLKSSVVDYYSASFFLTNPDLPAAGIRANSVAVRRLRFVGDGVLEQIVALNSSSAIVQAELRLACGADFADLFEVRSSVRDRRALTVRAHDERCLRFRYTVPRFAVETKIGIRKSEIIDSETRRSMGGVAAQIDGDDLVWRVELPPRHALVTEIDVSLDNNGVTLQPVHEEFGEPQKQFEGPLAHWLAVRPQFDSDSPLLKSVFDQSVVDLAALRVSGDLNGEPYVMPAAGLPWFMTLFGRDTIITSFQTLSIGPELVRGALHLLGDAQGQAVDDFRDEEPGRILHEIRGGELTVLGEKPHSPYYGASGGTPRWLPLLAPFG